MIINLYQIITVVLTDKYILHFKRCKIMNNDKMKNKLRITFIELST